MSAELDTWRSANQRHLVASLALVREALDRHTAKLAASAPAEGREPVHVHNHPSRAALRALAEAEATLPGPAALSALVDVFGLSSFERDVVLLCAGMELDASFSARCGAAQGEPQRGYPTFSLALASLPDAHWSAVAPGAPLRRFNLVHVDPGPTITACRLRIDERVLHHLTGLGGLDDRLRGLVDLVPPAELDALAPSHAALARRLAGLWGREDGEARPVLMLCGQAEAAKAPIAAAACALLGLRLHALRAGDVPAQPGDRDELCRLWERESALGASALLLECEDGDPPEALRAAGALIDRLGGLLVVSTRDPLRPRKRLVVRLDVKPPEPLEQEVLWKGALGSLGVQLNGQLQGVVSQFSLGAAGIQAVSLEVRQRLADAEAAKDALPVEGLLWEACRAQARPRLDDLAHRIDPAAGWDDLVLPPQQMLLLRQLSAHVRQRARVYEAWGFSRKGARGLGISVLFSGNSGTGKTMAAEVLARELRLDLYRIDLSQVVSKFIGETEKNLRRIFDAAEEGGALLLFDEADALFGKRSEIKDSHDRYANLEVSYLLQRMEAYRGLAVLTTNLRGAVDAAFLRRLRFIVEFPFPDAEQRSQIWRRVFPAETPTDGLDYGRLARLSLAGGNIRSIALNAAFLAADADEPVRMRHLAQAARSEYLKLEKPLGEAEIGGWT